MISWPRRAASCITGRDATITRLSYELQAEAAARGIGVSPAEPSSPPTGCASISGTHARSTPFHATAGRNASRPGLLFAVASALEVSPVRTPDFPSRARASASWSRRGCVSRSACLDVFRYVAMHGVMLSREAEDQIREALSGIFDAGSVLPELWSNLRQILLAPHAAEALRAMHSSGLLVHLFPEFGVIDSLVIRDFYHHYTVDAHSFMAIENIHRLRGGGSKLGASFRQSLFRAGGAGTCSFFRFSFMTSARECPATIMWSAAWRPSRKFSRGSDLKPEQADTVRFLIRDHLAMSANLLAARYLRSGNDSRFCRTGRHPGTTEAALSFHVCGYSRGQSRSADSLESGIAVAALCFYRQLSEPQPGRRAHSGPGGRLAIRGPHFPAGFRERIARAAGFFSRWTAAPLPLRAFP